MHPISSPSLPSVIDIIAEGTVGSNVQPLDVSRPYSETIAYNFTGVPESIITIDLFDQLDDSKYFSLSVWMYLDTPTYNGIILAKSSSDGTTIYYGLGIANDNNDNTIIIRFYYLPDTEQVSPLYCLSLSLSLSSFSPSLSSLSPSPSLSLSPSLYCKVYFVMGSILF